jgi:hypothetical protein
MAITQADIDALDRAIIGAELEVEYQGRRVKFRSVQELIAAHAHAKAVVAGAATAASGGPRGQYRFTFTTQRGD